MWNDKLARRVRREIENLCDRRVSQSELAGWLGYSRESVAGWEQGRTRPDPAVQFLYWKMDQDPGFINEIHQWSKLHGPGQSQASEAAAS